MNTATLKEKFLGSVETWIEERIDEMAKNNVTMTVPAVYMKRGCHNILKKYEEKIEDSIDTAALFLADENGEINADILFSDFLEMFRGMEDTTFDMGILKGVIGKGKIALTLPENMLTNIIFGSRKTLTFNEDDIRELKMLIGE